MYVDLKYLLNPSQSLVSQQSIIIGNARNPLAPVNWETGAKNKKKLSNRASVPLKYEEKK